MQRTPGLPPSSAESDESASRGQDELTRRDCFPSLDPLTEDCGKSEIASVECPASPDDIECPTQQTIVYEDLSDYTMHMVRTVCNTWKCPWCGPRKRAALTAKIALAKPNRFITLTTDPATGDTPRQVYDWSRRQISELAKVIRKRHGEFEYVRAIEQTKKGWPHYHLLVRSPYLDQKELSHCWCHLTRAFIVDIRALTKDERAARYVTKYLTKQTSCDFTTRRLSWTKGFFMPEEKPKESGTIAADIHRYNQRPEDVQFWEYPQCSWEKLNNWHWRRKR